MAPQYSTPSSVFGQNVFLRHVDAREDEQQHRDSDAPDVRLDAERLAQQVAEEDPSKWQAASSAVP